MNAAKGSRAKARTSSHRENVLVIDDDPYMRMFLSRGLDQWFGEVKVVAGLSEAKVLLSAGEHYEAIVCDYHLADGRGSDLYQWIIERGLSTPFLLISGGIISKPQEASFRFLKKPFALKELLDALSDIIHSRQKTRR
ncbi:MAG: response regulator [Chthoniobacteraceae bacterium]